jgi:integral membrane protein (TIGR01906 family)
MGIFKGILIFITPLWIIGISTRIVFNPWFIDFEYSKKDFPKDRWGLDDGYRKFLAKLGLEAVLSKEGLEEFAKAKLPDGRKAFRKKEIDHMKDVNKFLKFFFPVSYLSFLVWSVGFFLSKKKSSYLIFSGIWTMVFILTSGLLIVSFYDKVFAFFHDTVFGEFTWRFRDNDTLLRIYPMKFWYDGTIVVIILSVMLSSFLVLLGGFKRKIFEKGL